MSINRADIEQVAALARIRIAEDDIDEVTRRLGEILRMVDQMQAVDTSGVEPLAHPLDDCQRLRPDAATEADRRRAFQAIAPAVEADLYLVPKVIE